MARSAIHPGEHLAEAIEALGVTAAQLARDLQVPGRELAGIHLAMDFLTAQNRRLERDELFETIEDAQHVWVDHCDLSNCTDSLLDIKHASDFVTVSWNHFHDHHKTTLVGHSDKPEIRAEVYLLYESDAANLVPTDA